MVRFSLRQLLAGVAVAAAFCAVLRLGGLLIAAHCALLVAVYYLSQRLPLSVRAGLAALASIFAYMVLCLEEDWWNEWGYRDSVLYSLLTLPIRMERDLLGGLFDTVTYGGEGVSSDIIRPDAAWVFWSSVAAVLWLTIAAAAVRKIRRRREPDFDNRSTGADVAP